MPGVFCKVEIAVAWVDSFSERTLICWIGDPTEGAGELCISSDTFVGLSCSLLVRTDRSCKNLRKYYNPLIGHKINNTAF